MNGDGRLDLIEKDGWWEQPASIADGALWTKHPFHFADAGSQMFALDLNGDHRADIVSCLNAHGYGLAWYEQKADATFDQHLIMGKKPEENAQGVCFTEPHAVAIADINGDGLPDIVTGKRHWAHGPEGDVDPNAPSVLYWFEAKKNASAPGGVEFVAHQIDDDSGVGTQVVVADLNGDKKPDIVVGNKKGVFVFIQTDGPTSQPAPAVDHFAENIRSTEPLAPEDERRAFHLPPGFEAQLVASEPDIAKPLNMAFDARGRLWVTETVEYPFPAQDRPGRDKIAILDIGPDGHATKFTTFAEGLNIPIGLYPYKDGCIAHSIPEIRRYFDDNGDDHADRSERLYGDIGHNDTHGMTNAFRRGFDGWLYANHGFNNISTITALDGSSIILNSGNTYRMRVDGSHIEQFTWGQTNPFGSCFDPLGNFYTSDSHSKPIYQLIRGGYYEGINKQDDGLGFAPPIMHHDHGSTAIAAAFYYAAEQFPKEWWGHMFVGNVVTSRINHDSLTYAGSSPTAHEEPDFLRSDDPWFRPNDMQLGPDGALYISDFYNRIIGHYEVPLNNPQRDHERGRIWRIVYKGNPIEPAPNLREMDVNGLIGELNNPNLTVRRLATDELSDRIGQASIEPIKQQLAAGKLTSIQKAHALWVLYRLGALDESLISAAAKDSDAFVRVHAMRMLAETKPWSDAEKALVLAGLKDADGLARRCAVDALGVHPSVDFIRPLLAVLDSTPAEDFELRYATRVALRNQLRDGDPQIFAQIDSLKLDDPEFVKLLDITPSVPNAGAAEFEIRHLDAISHDEATSLKVLKHATKFAATVGITDAAVAQIRKLMPDDLDQQLQLFLTMQQATEQRGQPLGDGVRDWGLALATQTLHATSSDGWTFHPLANAASPSPNPWQVQHRASVDGNADALFWSSVCGGETLTGVIRSPDFVIPDKLTFFIAGHNGNPTSNALPRNVLRLRSAQGNRVLAETLPPRNDRAQPVTWDLHAVAGQSGYLEGVDGDTNRSFAWLAFGRLDPPVVSVPKGMLSNESLVRAADVTRILHLDQLSDDLTRLMSDPVLDPPARTSVALALASFGSEAALKSLGQTLLDPATPDPLSQQIVSELSQVDSDAARAALAGAMATTPAKVQSNIARALVKTSHGSETLLATIEAGHAPARLLQEREIVDALGAADIPDVQKRIASLTKGLPAISAQVQQIIDQRRAAFAAASGQHAVSINRGAQVFAATCTACHQLDGQGRQIGPQLNGIGTRGADRLIEDVLDPSRNVDPAFRYTTLVLKNGDVVTGLFRREDPPGVLIFVDATAKEVPVPKDKIQRRIESGASLMPDNFSSAIKPNDFNDLIAYLLSHRQPPSK